MSGVLCALAPGPRPSEAACSEGLVHYLWDTGWGGQGRKQPSLTGFVMVEGVHKHNNPIGLYVQLAAR